MKYSCSITVDLQRDHMVSLLENTDNMVHWQEGFVSFEHASGEKGTPGSTAKIVYKMGNRDLVMTETVVVHNPPEEFSATYEADKVWNLVENKFTDQGDKTLCVVDSEFKCGGFLRIMAFFMPGMFKKQTMKFMTDFKNWAETQSA